MTITRYLMSKNRIIFKFLLLMALVFSTATVVSADHDEEHTAEEDQAWYEEVLSWNDSEEEATGDNSTSGLGSIDDPLPESNVTFAVGNTQLNDAGVLVTQGPDGNWYRVSPDEEDGGGGGDSLGTISDGTTTTTPPPPNALPDFISANLASSGTLVAGTPITFSGNIKNQGNGGTAGSTQVPQGAGTPITTGSTWPAITGLSAAFDGNDSQNHDNGQGQGQSGISTATFALGKDWGAGNSKKINRIILIGSNNLGINNSGASSLNAQFQGSADGVSWTAITSFTITSPTVAGPTPAVDRVVSSAVGYRFHRIVWTSGNNNFVAEMKFYEESGGASLARFCIDNASCLTSLSGRLGGDETVPVLSAGALSGTLSRSWIATAGTHTIILCADVGAAITESDETNNCTELPLTVATLPTIADFPDLTATNLASSGTLTVGSTITFSGTVKNQGGTNAPASAARLCIDNANCLTSTTNRLGTDQSVASLAGGATSASFSRPWTATVGSHTVYFCADVGGAVNEWNENNNCTQLTVGVIFPPGNPVIGGWPPGTTIPPFPAPGTTIIQVPFGETAVIRWTSENTASCSVTGSNGDGPWTGLSGEQTTSPIVGTTTYVISCIDLNGDATPSRTVIVQVNPQFEEF